MAIYRLLPGRSVGNHSIRGPGIEVAPPLRKNDMGSHSAQGSIWHQTRYETTKRLPECPKHDDENIRQQRGSPPLQNQSKMVKTLISFICPRTRINTVATKLAVDSSRPTLTFDTMTSQRLAAVLVSLYITSLTRRVSCCTGNSAILFYCQGAAFTPVAKLSAW